MLFLSVWFSDSIFRSCSVTSRLHALFVAAALCSAYCFLVLLSCPGGQVSIHHIVYCCDRVVSFHTRRNVCVLIVRTPFFILLHQFHPRVVPVKTSPRPGKIGLYLSEQVCGVDVFQWLLLLLLSSKSSSSSPQHYKPSRSLRAAAVDRIVLISFSQYMIVRMCAACSCFQRYHPHASTVTPTCLCI